MNPKMAAIGPLFQLAFAPGDVDATLRYWTEVMGAGPFFRISHVQYLRAAYRGVTSSVDFSGLIGYWGDIQIEILEQHNDAPSVYKAWRDLGREGLHHVCLRTDDIARARRIAADAGASIEQEFWLEGAEAFYADAGDPAGVLVEVFQSNPAMDALFSMMHDASRRWDGRDPVRDVG